MACPGVADGTSDVVRDDSAADRSGEAFCRKIYHECVHLSFWIESGTLLVFAILLVLPPNRFFVVFNILVLSYAGIFRLFSLE